MKFKTIIYKIYKFVQKHPMIIVKDGKYATAHYELHVMNKQKMFSFTWYINLKTEDFCNSNVFTYLCFLF